MPINTIESIEDPSFWKINKTKFIRIIGLGVTSGIVVAISIAVYGLVSRKFDTNIYTVLSGGIGIGGFLVLLVILGSWISFEKMKKILGFIEIGEANKFQEIRYVYSDNGSKWSFFQKKIEGKYRNIPFSITYFPYYDQNNDQRGLHIQLEKNVTRAPSKSGSIRYPYNWKIIQSTKFESNIILTLKELKSVGRIDLSVLLEEILNEDSP